MPLEITAHAGFCMGVRRAVDAALKAAEDGKPLSTLGELTHNPQVVALLAEKGAPAVSGVDAVGGREVLIRSHGVTPQIMHDLKDMGVSVMDCTCPFVEKLHQMVTRYSAGGKPVILVGQKDHPEVTGTAGWCKGPVYILKEEAEVGGLPPMEEALAVVQTTFPPEEWERIANKLRAAIPAITSVFVPRCARRISRLVE